MPRNGSDVYALPPGSEAIPGETVASEPYNTALEDIVNDLNGARPVTAGGTGATSQAAALIALGAQPVDADLTAIAALGYTARSRLVKSAANTWELEPEVASSVTLPRGYIDGFRTANNATDATNDIDFSVGSCRDCTNAADLAATTAMTKQLDASWAAGSAAGMRDTGSIANATWHLHAIRKDSDNTIDFIASLSHDDSATVTMTIASPCVVTWLGPKGQGHGLVAGSSFRLATTGGLPTNVAGATTYYVLATGLTATTFRFAATQGGTAINATGSQSGVHTAQACPVMPSGYTYFRRIASIVRASSAIRAYIQDGEVFTWATMAEDVSFTTVSATAIATTMTVPYGLRARVFGTLWFTGPSGGTGMYLMSDLAQPDTSPAQGNCTIMIYEATYYGSTRFEVTTSPAAQIRRRGAHNSGAVGINTVGWIDGRGRNA